MHLTRRRIGDVWLSSHDRYPQLISCSYDNYFNLFQSLFQKDAPEIIDSKLVNMENDEFITYIIE